MAVDREFLYMGDFFSEGMKPGSGFIPMKPVWNRYETGYETGPPDNGYETGMKPSLKTIFVGSRSETGYETGYDTEPQKDLFEAGLKPGQWIPGRGCSKGNLVWCFWTKTE